MLFTRVVSFIAVFLTLGTLSLASPAAGAADIAKRDNADIEDVFTTLKASTDSILPQIQNVTANGNATDATVTPLLNNLKAALDTASSSLSGLASSSPTVKKRQSDNDIATLIAGIISDIVDALDGLLGESASIPDISELLGGIDTSLNQVLVGLETLLSGVLELVADLLTDVSSLLNQLAFGLTLGTLGL